MTKRGQGWRRHGGGAALRERLLAWFQANPDSVFHTGHIGEAFPNFSWGGVRNVLVQLKKENLIENPIPRYWTIKGEGE